MTNTFTLADDAPCTVELVRKIRSKITTLLKKQGELQLQIDDLLLAVSEHLANLSEHGDGLICDLYWHSDSRTFECRDNGNSIEALLKGASLLDDSEQTFELQESGMGLSLITTLFPDYRYLAADDRQPRNRLLIRLPKPRHKLAVVDDDPVFLELLKAYLEADYDLVTYGSATEALAQNLLAQVSLVIADMHMPGFNGIELRKHLLDDDQTANTPFIFLTGDESATKRQSASELQIDDYLLKPINKARLIDTIERVLLRSQRIKSRLNAQIDSRINRSLWPKGPWQIGPVQADYAYVVAERGGGDFLFHHAYEDKQRFVLGDVMGHGEQAKFFAFSMSGFITGLSAASTEATECSAFLNRLSGLLCHSELMMNTLVTLQVIDIYEDGTVEICSAGHPPPFLLAKNAAATEVDVNGPLPGMSEDAHYQSVRLQLSKDQSLMFYTDGLVEALLMKDCHTALAETLNALQQQSTQVLNAGQLATELAFENRLLDDDVSVFSVFFSCQNDDSENIS
ncbi:SpoIIE family protein phosphatase [Reinekea marinisedimentorum]|uniref:Serine/threonine-protein kinase RsbW/sigma-B regulation protein RsbU (Phosphoserine phosphatase) n=1 Tax=Reinekea marinisedimentorum TaxID=230495 RepID=A0A4R3I820_9GAMM|nr:SpoIIE family protein phosphatase [Reinekea marinisedimentorum]TCS42392.1 serine/threonine-protein kinase RsbW/sigma-B regulation protein RsbU (phosphoserine phosphatase) [Reinekea marinisedimentorum]